jgi:protein-tyrosine kinase
VLGVKRRQTTSINKSAEQIKILRSNIEKQLADNESHMLMITSPRGLSPHIYISSHLAISFAEQGKNVLLVDANVRNPTLHTYFNLPNTKGFLDVVVYSENVFTHVRNDYLKRLSILTAGKMSDTENDIWISKKVKNAMKTWKEKFDLVLFHAPSYLELSDAQVLIDHCDGVLLVVQSGRTKMKDAVAAKQQISLSNKPILGVIYQKR